MKGFLAIVLAVVLFSGLCFALGLWLIGIDERRARERCAVLHAEPVRVGSGRHLCVTSDGRVVGR